jgi:hypothetical protein
LKREVFSSRLTLCGAPRELFRAVISWLLSSGLQNQGLTQRSQSQPWRLTPVAPPNEPRFVFRFNVAGADISPAASLFFNVLFGDYDVVPADITLTFASAPQRTLALATQSGAADGLIQAAFANLLFGEVFTADATSQWTLPAGVPLHLYAFAKTVNAPIRTVGAVRHATTAYGENRAASPTAARDDRGAEGSCA